MILSKIISSSVVKGKLLIKILGLGSKDVQTVYNVLPFGLESNPSSNLRAIWAKTANYEDRILLGILFNRPTINKGETKLYSENANGEEAFTIYLKNDGSCELGGDTNNLVKYNELKSGFDKLKEDLNKHIQDYNTHTHAGVMAGGSSTAVTSAMSVESEASIDASKSNTLKTK